MSSCYDKCGSAPKAKYVTTTNGGNSGSTSMPAMTSGKPKRGFCKSCCVFWVLLVAVILVVVSMRKDKK
jgi:hypothetical protein